MSEDTKTNPDEQWAVLELQEGRVSVAGKLSAATIGTDMLRLDIPQDGGYRTSYFQPSAIHAIHLASEDVCRLHNNANPWRPGFAHEVEDFLHKTEERLTLHTPRVSAEGLAFTACAISTQHMHGSGSWKSFRKTIQPVPVITSPVLAPADRVKIVDAARIGRLAEKLREIFSMGRTA